MPIEKIKIIKSDLEKLFDKIAPNWKEQILYTWQYGGEHPKESATERLYNLEEYKTSQGGNLTIYAKGRGFIVELKNRFGFTDVLTNIKPSSGISPNDPREMTINELNILWK